MKKVVIAAFALFTFSALSASAQTTAPATQTEPATQTTPPAQTEQAPAATEDKTAVKLEDLPEAVKATLAGPSLKAWSVTEAFLVKTAEGKEYYAINVKKDNESGSIQLDKDGKPVK